MIELDKLKDYDCAVLKILVKPGTKINFERGNMLMISKSAITKEEWGVHSAEYLGEGKWCMDKKTPLRNSKGDSK